jgi:hypothetical protein
LPSPDYDRMGCGGSKGAAEGAAEPASRNTVRKTIAMRWSAFVSSGKGNEGVRQSDLDWAEAMANGEENVFDGEGGGEEKEGDKVQSL